MGVVIFIFKTLFKRNYAPVVYTATCTYDTHSTIYGLGSHPFLLQKNNKNNQLHVYIFRENIIILTIYHSNNCDGTLYSQEIVRIQKVFNKEGWIVAN